MAKTSPSFQTEERKRSLHWEWDNTTLAKLRRNHLNKNMSECLRYLASSLLDIQCWLPQQYRNNVIMREKLLNAIWDSPACRLAYQKSASTIRGVIADFQESVAPLIDVDQNNSPTTNYVDRRRHVHHRGNTFNIGSRSGGGFRNERKCIVCSKPNCWSTNHLFCERLNAHEYNKHIKAVAAQLTMRTRMMIRLMKNMKNLIFLSHTF